MKKQATVVVLGALLSVVVTGTSFAEGASQAKHHARTTAASPYQGYYDSALPEGNYTTYAPSYNTGGFSGALGGVGR